MQPSLFYGTAISTCLGLALGLALHGPWQSHAGGPQILFASAAAAELARPLNDADIIEAAAPAEQPAYADIAYGDADQLPADPLPVTRLTARGGVARPAAAEIERVSAEAPTADNPGDASAADDNATAPIAQAGDQPMVTASYTPVADRR